MQQEKKSNGTRRESLQRDAEHEGRTLGYTEVGPRSRQGGEVISPLKELRRAIAESRVARRSTVPVGRSPQGSVSLHRSLHQRAGRRGADGLADSGGSLEPAAKRPAPDVGSAQPHASTSRATGEQAAFGGRHVSPEGGATYAAVAAAAEAAATAKWDAQAQSQGFEPDRTRHHPRDGTKANVP